MRTVLDLDRLVTAEEFWRMPEGDELQHYRWELVDGRVVRMTGPGARHAVIAARVAEILSHYARTSGVGLALGEVRYLLGRNPDTLRGPDVSFVRHEQLTSGIPVGWFQGAPDLAVEIISPDNRAAELCRKLADYLEAGSQVAWVVDPDDKTVTVHRLHAQPQTLGICDTLDGGDLLPGLSCEVATIFEGL
jgi:Uma2 family endonuclease